MRGLRLGWVWAAAAWVALTVVVRIVRGEVVVMSGYAAPVVRLVALMLVFVASCAEKLRPAPEQKPQDLSQGAGEAGAQDMSQGTGPAVVVEPAAVRQEFPPQLTQAAAVRMYNWFDPRGLATRIGYAREAGSARDLLADALAEPDTRVAAEVLLAALDGFLARRKKGEAETAATLRALLAAAEALPLFDAWFAGLVWRHAREIHPAPVDVYARVERQLRVAHALVLAQASTGPIEFSAWMSKAGPPVGWQHVQVPAGLVDQARAVFDRGADAGLFETAAVLQLEVVQGDAVLVRRGEDTAIAAGGSLRLRRLDVVRVRQAAVLRHTTLGEISVAAGGEVTAWNVGGLLGLDGQARVRGWVDAAMAGDAKVLAQLEAVLPAAHAAMRAAVQARPDAAGAAAVRTLLTAFDE